MKAKEKTVVSEKEQIISTSQTDVESEKKAKKKIQFPKMRWWLKIITITIPLLVVLLVVILFAKSQKNDTQVTTISKSSLQEVIEINELSTVDYSYNATATKYDKNKDAKYHVAYEGTVTAGIDFSKIEIEIDEEEKKVNITLPEIEIHSTKVDMGTMEYIFTKSKYETEDVSQEAYKLCKNDLEKRIKKENLLYETAKENAISSVEALFKPWFDTLNDTYTVEIK